MSMDLHPFDPDSGLTPEVADFDLLRERSGGFGIILIPVPDVETPSWCARAAAALVTSWSARGARIVFADVSLRQPVLHDVFGLPNSKGITDVMMAGAQLRAVSRLVGSPGFLFIPTGAQSADAADVMRSGRWDIVFKALGEANVDLVIYAPADLPGLDALLARSSAVLLLGGDPKVAEEVIQTLGLSEGAGLRPPVLEGTSGGMASPSVAPEAQAEGRKRAYLRWVPPWRPAAAVGLLVLAAWAGSMILLGGEAESLAVPEERAEPPVPVIAPVPDPTQGYSLSLAAFQDAGQAAHEAEELAGRRADLLFTTVPVRVSGRVFHRVLAGPATDSGAAEELRTSLAETLSGENSALWIVRATPLAFTLGDYESRAAADRRAQEASVAWLSPYVFEIGASDRTSFRVFSGAYADNIEASVVQARFQELREEPLELVRRVGRYVPRP